MLYIRTTRPNLNTQNYSIRAQLVEGTNYDQGQNRLFMIQFFFNFIHPFIIYIRFHTFYFHMIMTFWQRRNVVLYFIIVHRRFLLSNVLPNLYFILVYVVVYHRYVRLRVSVSVWIHVHIKVWPHIQASVRCVIMSNLCPVQVHLNV